jgi:hypothetical protein
MFAPVADWIGDTPNESVMKAAPEAFLNGAGTEPLTVILTARARAEIEASFAQAFGADMSEDRYQARADCEAIINAASNVLVDVVNFDDLIHAPLAVFTTLADAGWPIDAAAAASTIDPALYRNR